MTTSWDAPQHLDMEDLDEQCNDCGAVIVGCHACELTEQSDDEELAHRFAVEFGVALDEEEETSEWPREIGGES